MPSTLSVQRIREEDIALYMNEFASRTGSEVSLPTLQRGSTRGGERQTARQPRQLNVAVAAPAPTAAPAQPAPGRRRRVQIAAPAVTPEIAPGRQTRKAPLVVQANRALRTVLVAACGLAILGYGLDVAASNDVGRMQEQARRLNEQNCELSAKLLNAISFQGIQNKVFGRSGLRVPDQVLMAKHVPPPEVPTFKPNRHQLPLMSGY